MQPYNPLKKIITSPIIRQSNIKTTHATPHNKRSHSIKNTHQLPATKSPHETATNIHQRDLIQDQILRLLQQNSKMMGLLTDFDYQIKVKVDQIGSIKDKAGCVRCGDGRGGGDRWIGGDGRDGRDGRGRSSNGGGRGESPILRQLKIIKTKLNAIDVRDSIQGVLGDA